MKKKNTKEEEELVFHNNPGVPNLFVDDLRVTIRGDGVATMSFYCLKDGATYEHVRVTTPMHRLHAMSQLINNQLRKFEEEAPEIWPVDSKEEK